MGVDLRAHAGSKRPGRTRAPPTWRARLSATLRRGRLTFELDEDEHGGPLLREITTPRGDTHPQEILVSHVLKYAAHTGMTPGDAARYAAEVLIGELMGLEVR